jgi:hypothetical protein
VFPLRVALLIAAFGSFLAVPWVLFSPLRRLREMPAVVDGGTEGSRALRLEPVPMLEAVYEAVPVVDPAPPRDPDRTPERPWDTPARASSLDAPRL